MINKLKKKFILVLMAFISLVILAALITICLSNYNKYRLQNDIELDHVLDINKGDFKPIIDNRLDMKPEKERPQKYLPVFTVELDNTNNIKTVNDTGVDVDKNIIDQAVKIVLDENRTDGYIKNLKLLYKVKNLSFGLKIAFADNSNDISSMKNLIIDCGIIFFICEVIFFIISIFLSKWMVKPVEEAWNRQQEFVADASHELKTPLTVILANTDIVESHPNATVNSQMKWVLNTHTEANRMKSLIEDLLFLAKSDISYIHTENIDIDISNITWQSVLLFEALAYERNIKIEEHIKENLHIKGNEKQIKQLIGILIDNGCKYGIGGKVSISLYENQGSVLLKINNTIKNKEDVIPKEELNKIFERFYRIDKSRDRKQGGYGLGLAIGKSIVTSHNGKIKVESSLEDGTTFIVSFHKIM